MTGTILTGQMTKPWSYNKTNSVKALQGNDSSKAECAGQTSMDRASQIVNNLRHSDTKMETRASKPGVRWGYAVGLPWSKLINEVCL